MSRIVNKTTRLNTQMLHSSDTCNKVPPALYQIQMKQPRVVHDLPIQVGFWVYSLSKLRMLKFYYDFLLKFFLREKFEQAQMYTYSLYLTINGANIEDILKPNVDKEYFTERFE